MLHSIQDAVKQILPAKRKTNSSSGWISFNGPCCTHNGESADKRGRAGLVANADGGVSYHCFNCNFKASYVPGRHLTYKFRKLLSWLGADDGTVQRLVIDAIRVKDLIAPEQLVEVIEQEEIKFKARPLPPNASDLGELGLMYQLRDFTNMPLEYVAAVVYVNDRKIDLNKYHFYWTPDTEHNMNKRVIIPFTWKNRIIGYTARTFGLDIKPKYYNSHEGNYVFNVDKQLKDAKFVIVVEGPFDAMSVDGVAILGNECSEIQADIIDSLGREVIVVPDADKAGANLVDKALEYGWSVSFPIWQDKHKDVASAVQEYGKLFVIKTILDARQSNRLKIELRKKKVYN